MAPRLCQVDDSQVRLPPTQFLRGSVTLSFSATSTRGYLMSPSFVLRGVVCVSVLQVFLRFHDLFAFGSESHLIVLTGVMSNQAAGITSSLSHMRTLAFGFSTCLRPPPLAASVFSLFPYFSHLPHDSATPQCKATLCKVRPGILCTVVIITKAFYTFETSSTNSKAYLLVDSLKMSMKKHFSN